MPNIVRNPQTGEMRKWDGQEWSALSDEDYGNLRPKKVLDEMGVPDSERFTLKNFAANPASGLAFLRAKHPDWDIVQYGDGLNYAVKQPSATEWKLVDPAGGGIGEFFRDFADLLVGDILLPTAGAVGGGAIGGPGGAAVGAAGSELARQGIGSALGIPQNIDVGQVATVGAVGGALAGTGALVGKVLRRGAGAVASGLEQRGMAGVRKPGGISRFVEQTTASITGVRPGKDLPVSQVILDTAARAGRPAVTPGKVAQIAQSHLDRIAPSVIGAKVAQRDALIPSGKTVNLHKLRTPLSQLLDIITGERTLEFGQSGTRRAVQEQLAAIFKAPSKAEIASRMGLKSNPGAVNAAYLAAKKQWENGMRNVPARDALYAKSWLQDFASSKGAFAGTGTAAPGSAARIDKKFITELSRFTDALNQHIKSQLDPGVRQLDREISGLIKVSNGLREELGVDATNPENFIKRVFEMGGSPANRLIRSYDAAFPGLKLYRLARESATGLRFTPIETSAAEFGVPSVRGRMTATGLPIGSALIGGVGGGVAGTMIGGPVGGAVGGLAGLGASSVAFSPAAITRMAPGAVRAGAAVSRGASRLAGARAGALGTATRAGAQAATSSSYGKHVASQDGKKRRAYYVGG